MIFTIFSFLLTLVSISAWAIASVAGLQHPFPALQHSSSSSIQGNMALQAGLLLVSLVLLVGTGVTVVESVDAWAVTTWTDSHATFYGGNDASGTMGGACGYGNMYTMGYGVNTAALSTTLFNNGASCGACFEIVCKAQESRWCYNGAGSIKVTATNFCPPNWAEDTNNGGWCNPPRTHFDLAYPMFAKMAQPVGGIVPVQYRRTPCIKSGGVRFQINGNRYFNIVLVYNVANAGDVTAMEMKGKGRTWYSMRRNWGDNWDLSVVLTNQPISFRVHTSDGKFLRFDNVADRGWNFGSTYESNGGVNF